jgi:hypothetical protein
MVDKNHNPRSSNNSLLRKKLDTAGWGLFFIWTGIAALAHVGWGAGLLGVGIIILGAQVTRKYFGLKLEGFWVVMGVFFVWGGVWEFCNASFDIFQYCVWH